ncbi:hypothetical protein C8Q74DRAFT_1216302 [Fomes fomentarius]|nr:hypothetical protein C8Q74DRAFT_1216302 [Fomes fomentarius]
MSANTAFAFARTASNLASSAFTTGSSTSSTKGPFLPNHRPNKLELQRKLLSSTIPQTTPSSASESLAASIDHQPWREIVEAPSPSMLPTPNFGRPHLPHRTSRNIFEAPSPSMLPTPPDFERPRFPHRRSRFSSAHHASQGIVGLGVFTLEEDAIVSPSHRQLHADSFRRTPGAPSGRKALTQCASETGHTARIGLGLMIAGQSFPGVV